MCALWLDKGDKGVDLYCNSLLFCPLGGHYDMSALVLHIIIRNVNNPYYRLIGIKEKRE